MQKPSGMLVLPLNRTPFKTDFESIAKAIVLEELKDFKCEIFLFGSRATAQNHRFSDMDIGIIPHTPLDVKVIRALIEKLRNSCIPFKVEVVDFSHVSESFKEDALKQVVQWK